MSGREWLGTQGEKVVRDVKNEFDILIIVGVTDLAMLGRIIAGFVFDVVSAVLPLLD